MDELDHFRFRNLSPPELLDNNIASSEDILDSGVECLTRGSLSRSSLVGLGLALLARSLIVAHE